MEGRGLLGRGRGREEGFGIFGKVRRAVGRVEAFREDNDFGTVAGGFEDLGVGAGEVGGFVGACCVAKEGSLANCSMQTWGEVGKW